MTADLKLNPYAALTIDAGGAGDCILIAPKVGEGLQTLNISKAEHPALHPLLADLSAGGLDLLDVEKDLDERQRELFARSGVLVTAQNTPEKPLFSCHLDEVETGEIAGNKELLKVNPTFRFEPFDLSKFRTLSNDKNFSPYLPTAWIKSAGVELDLGFWVSHEQASVISRFSAGEPVPPDIESLLSAKLAAAGIIVDPVLYREAEEIAGKKLSEAKELFSRHKYAIVRNVVPNGHVSAMQVFYRAYVEQGFMWFGDTRVPRRFHLGNEPLARFFHLSLTDLMSKLAGCEVKPSYCYAASYREGADLKPHVDREACEYSFSLQIEYEPEPAGGVSPWPLCLSAGKAGADGVMEWNGETESAVQLRNGDCLAYRGRELVHYRSTLPEGHKSTSIFFHYVPLDFDGPLI